MKYAIEWVTYENGAHLGISLYLQLRPHDARSALGTKNWVADIEAATLFDDHEGASIYLEADDTTLRLKEVDPQWATTTTTT